jgi:hypothetical protein
MDTAVRHTAQVAQVGVLSTEMPGKGQTEERRTCMAAAEHLAGKGRGRGWGVDQACKEWRKEAPCNRALGTAVVYVKHLCSSPGMELGQAWPKL